MRRLLAVVVALSALLGAGGQGAGPAQVAWSAPLASFDQIGQPLYVNCGINGTYGMNCEVDTGDLEGFTLSQTMATYLGIHPAPGVGALRGLGGNTVAYEAPNIQVSLCSGPIEWPVPMPQGHGVCAGAIHTVTTTGYVVPAYTGPALIGLDVLRKLGPTVSFDFQAGTMSFPDLATSHG
jgi:hypothetical protein